MSIRQQALIAAGLLAAAILALAFVCWGVPRVTFDPMTGDSHAVASCLICALVALLLGAACTDLVRDLRDLVKDDHPVHKGSYTPPKLQIPLPPPRGKRRNDWEDSWKP